MGARKCILPQFGLGWVCCKRNKIWREKLHSERGGMQKVQILSLTFPGRDGKHPALKRWKPGLLVSKSLDWPRDKDKGLWIRQWHIFTIDPVQGILSFLHLKVMHTWPLLYFSPKSWPEHMPSDLYFSGVGTLCCQAVCLCSETERNLTRFWFSWF